MYSNKELWITAKDELVSMVTSIGFPAEPGYDKRVQQFCIDYYNELGV